MKSRKECVYRSCELYLDELRADLDVQVARTVCLSCFQEPVYKVLNGTGYFVSL